jgi:hypothetical protein
MKSLTALLRDVEKAKTALQKAENALKRHDKPILTLKAKLAMKRAAMRAKDRAPTHHQE